MCRAIGLHGAKLIADGSTLMTHCNAGGLATAALGTALSVMFSCQDQGKQIAVFVDETRPLWQGARLTAWELIYGAESLRPSSAIRWPATLWLRVRFTL